MKTLDVIAAAKACFCHEDTIRKYIRDGKLLACKVGRSYVIKQEDLDDLLVRLTSESRQLVLKKRSASECQYTKEKTFGTLMLPHQAVKELDAALGLLIKN
jgi:excisionase family DNA binding protein